MATRRVSDINSQDGIADSTTANGLRLTPYTYAKLVKYTSINSFENPNILRSYVYGTNKGVYRSSVQRY